MDFCCTLWPERSLAVWVGACGCRGVRVGVGACGCGCVWVCGCAGVCVSAQARGCVDVWGGCFQRGTGSGAGGPRRLASLVARWLHPPAGPPPRSRHDPLPHLCMPAICIPAPTPICKPDATPPAPTCSPATPTCVANLVVPYATWMGAVAKPTPFLMGLGVTAETALAAFLTGADTIADARRNLHGGGQVGCRKGMGVEHSMMGGVGRASKCACACLLSSQGEFAWG